MTWVLASDFDGVLAGTLPWYRSFHKAFLPEYGFKGEPTDEISKSICLNWVMADTADFGIGWTNQEQVAYVNACLDQMPSYIASGAIGKIPLLAGVVETIQAAKSMGLEFVIVTSVRRDIVHAVFESHGFMKHVNTIRCARSIELEPDRYKRKPDPSKLLCAIDSVGSTPNKAIYIGDTPKDDSQMGTNAGVRLNVGITTGFNKDPELFIKNGAHQVIHRYDELLPLIEQTLSEDQPKKAIAI